MRLLIVLAAAMALAGCSGGGGRPAPATPATPTTPVQPPESETHRGAHRVENNSISFLQSWYANPQIDLPQDGHDGLQVIRPAQGGAAFPALSLSPSLRDRLEPGWRFNSHARARLDYTGELLWTLANQAYLQWTRHLDYDPGSLSLQIGSHGNFTCHNKGLACYLPNLNAVVLNDAWIADNYHTLKFAALTGNNQLAGRVVEELFVVMTHEAGHQFGYRNPDGTKDGCGQTRCHAPYGSGSVISYDHLRGTSVRYHVTEEDIRHVPNAAWKSDERDSYSVLRAGAPASIDNWGVWIDHYFSVDGQTTPGRLSGGNLSIVDRIGGHGLVRGKPSKNVSLTSTATWSGEDNFLGVDFGPDYLGALLRADANLRYTFGVRPNLNLRVNNFEAHYSTGGSAAWHDHNFTDWGDFSYNMDCAPGGSGCSGERVEAKWYSSDAGDPSGWVGGVVSDRDNDYAGSFVAEKD